MTTPYIITPPAAEPLTIAQAKRHLREVWDDADNDADILTMVSAARETCEQRAQRTLVTTMWGIDLDAFPRVKDSTEADAIRLAMPPIQRVNSVRFYDTEGVLRLLDPADYVLTKGTRPGYVVPAPGKTWPATQQRTDAVSVQFTAGYGDTPAAIPAALRLWIVCAVRDLYDNRARSAEAPQVPQNFVEHLIHPFCTHGV